MSMPKPLAYVFGGGATYGAAQLGMLRALADTDLEPDFVIGTSVGSLNAAVFAQNPEIAVDYLSELWASPENNAVFKGKVSGALQLARGRNHLLDATALQQLLAQYLQARRFEELKLPTIAVTTDLDTAETVTFAEGELLKPLQASAAIPGVFPYVEISGRRLVDGGVTANVAIRQAIAAGAKSVVVLDCGLVVAPKDDANTILQLLMQTVAIMTGAQVRRDLALAVKEVPVLYLPTVDPGGMRPDSFNGAMDMAERAYEASARFLRGVYLDGPGLYGSPPVLFPDGIERDPVTGEIMLAP